MYSNYLHDATEFHWNNYSDVIMSAMASQITGVSIVYSTVCSGADQRKHQSSASLAFLRGIHWWPVNSPHKGPVKRKNVSIWWRHHGMFNISYVRMLRYTILRRDYLNDTPQESQMLNMFEVTMSVTFIAFVARTAIYYLHKNIPWFAVVTPLYPVKENVLIRKSVFTFKVIQNGVKPFLSEALNKSCFRVDL